MCTSHTCTLSYTHTHCHTHTHTHSHPPDSDSDVCLHALRLLQSLLLEEEVLAHVASNLLSSLPLGRIRQLAASRHLGLRQTAQETLEDLGPLGPSAQEPEKTPNKDHTPFLAKKRQQVAKYSGILALFVV